LPQEEMTQEPEIESRMVHPEPELQASKPQIMQGPFRLLGADAHESLYAQKRQQQQQQQLEEPQSSQSMPQASQGLPEPEVFIGDHLPDDTEALAASNMLSVPEQEQRVSLESPSSDYGDRQLGHETGLPVDEPSPLDGASLQPSDAQDFARAHSSHSTNGAPELSNSTPTDTDTDADGALTPRASSFVPGTDKETLPPLAQIHLQSPYPIIAGPAPYKNNPVLPVVDNASDAPAGSSPTDQLLQEAAHSTAPGVYTANVDVPASPPRASTLYARGSLFPAMARQDTTMTVSDLKLPGGFPKSP